MRPSRCALTGLCLLSWSCAQGPQAHTITAVGFSGKIRNVSLARSAAHNRALDGLHKLLHPITFQWIRAEQGHNLSLKLDSHKISSAQVEFSPSLNNQWMATARLTLPDGPPHPPSNHKLRSGSATVQHENLLAAYRVAETRALRELLSAGGASTLGIYQGEVKLVDLQVHQNSGTLTVEVKGYVRVKSKKPVKAQARYKALEATVQEHRSVSETDLLLTALENIGRVDLKRRPQLAAERFSECTQLAPPEQRTRYLKLEAQALRRLRSRKAKRRLRQIRSELASQNHP